MTDNLQYSGVPSGFPSLDKITGGWQPSDLIVVAARPSVGKTSFALTVARNAAMDYRIPVAFFSLEAPADQLAKRIMVSETVIAKHKNGECADVPLKFIPSELRFVMPLSPDLMLMTLTNRIIK